MNKKGALISLLLLIILLGALIVSWGLVGAQEVKNNDYNCTVNYGKLCLKWYNNSLTEDEQKMVEEIS